MLLSFLRPLGATVAIASTTFVDGDGAVLLNGQPGATARFAFPGPFLTSTTVTISVVFPFAFVPRLVGLFNTTLPVGTKVTMQFKRPADGAYGYGALVQHVVQKPHGERLALAGLISGLDAISAVQYVIANDVAGVAAIVVDSLQDIGELWCGPGLWLDMEPPWTTKYDDATVVSTSEQQQPSRVQKKTPRRIHTLPLATLLQDEVYAGALEQGYDLESIIAATDRAQPCVIVPRYLDETGVYSASLTNRTASFGYMSQAATNKHLDGPFFGPGEWQHTEAPTPV